MTKTRIQAIDHLQHKNMKETPAGDQLIAPTYGEVKLINSSDGGVNTSFIYDGSAEDIVQFIDKIVDRNSGAWIPDTRYGIITYKNNIQVHGTDSSTGEFVILDECGISDKCTTVIWKDPLFHLSNSMMGKSLESKKFAFPNHQYKGYWAPGVVYSKGDVVIGEYKNRGVGEDTDDATGFLDAWIAQSSGTSTSKRPKVANGLLEPQNTPDAGSTPPPFSFGSKPSNMTQAYWDSLQPENFNGALGIKIVDFVPSTCLSDDIGVIWAPFRRRFICGAEGGLPRTDEEFEIKAIKKLESGCIAVKIRNSGLAFYRYNDNSSSDLFVDLDQLEVVPTGVPDIFYLNTELFDGYNTINLYTRETALGNLTVSYEGRDVTRVIKTSMLDEIGNLIIENYEKKSVGSYTFVGFCKPLKGITDNLNFFIQEQIITGDTFLYFNHGRTLHKIKIIVDNILGTCTCVPISEYEFPENVENICIKGDVAAVITTTKTYEIDIPKFDKLNSDAPVPQDIISINGSKEPTDIVIMKSCSPELSTPLEVHYTDGYKITFNSSEEYPHLTHIKDVDLYQNHLYILHSDGLLLLNENNDGIHFHTSDNPELSYVDIQHQDHSFGGTKEILSSYECIDPNLPEVPITNLPASIPCGPIETNVNSYRSTNDIYVVDESCIIALYNDLNIFARITDDKLSRKFVSVVDDESRTLISKSESKVYVHRYDYSPEVGISICTDNSVLGVHQLNKPQHPLQVIEPDKMFSPKLNTKGCVQNDIVPVKFKKQDYLVDSFREKTFMYSRKNLSVVDNETGAIIDNEFVQEELNDIKVYANKLYTVGHTLKKYNIDPLDSTEEIDVVLNLVSPTIAFVNRFYVIINSYRKTYYDNIITIYNNITGTINSYEVPVTKKSKAYIFNNFLYLACNDGMRIYDMNMNLINTIVKESSGYNMNGVPMTMNNICSDVIGVNENLFALYEPNKEIMYLPNDKSNNFNSSPSGIKAYNSLIDGTYKVFKDIGLTYEQVHYKLVIKNIQKIDNNYEVKDVTC